MDLIVILKSELLIFDAQITQLPHQSLYIAVQGVLFLKYDLCIFSW